MTKIIGNVNSEIGTIVFQITAGKFEIQTNYRKFFVTDDEIKFNNGKYYFDVSKENLALKLKEIEIPKIVIERKNAVFQEIEFRKNSIDSMETPTGTIYFSIENNTIVVRLGDKEAISAEIETIHGKPAISVKALGLDHPYLLLPVKVEKEFRKLQEKKSLENVKLEKAGTNLLNGKEYYRLSEEIPTHWPKIKEYFVFFNGNPDLKWDLTGWLTCEPEKVKDILSFLRKCDI